MRIWRTVLLALVAVTLSPAAQGQPVSAETEQLMRALATWLDSEDSDAERLKSLAKYGQKAVPSLIAALDAGPSPAKRELARRSLETQYETLARSVKFKLRSKTDYVQYYVGNFETLYRMRAAEALALIGGPEARKALEQALGQAGREDLKQVIQRALASIK